MSRLRVAIVSLVLAVPAWIAPTQSRADVPSAATDDDRKSDAIRFFAKGSEHYVAKRYVEALDALRASSRLVASPNSTLMIARCLRELDRLADAAEAFRAAEAEALRRSGDDASYMQTAAAANTEGAAVRARLGSIRITVRAKQPETRLLVDDVALPLADSEVVVWHAPGSVRVRVVSPSGAEEQRELGVRAASDQEIAFDGNLPSPSIVTPPPSTVTPEPEPASTSTPSGRPNWTLPGAAIAGGVALVGAGVFAGFGAASHSTYETLRDRCGPAACGPADRADADRGRTDQSVANVGLVVGIVGAVAAATLLVIHFTSPTADRPTASGRQPSSTRWRLADGASR